MIIGLGNDMIDIRRIEKTLERFDRRFIDRIFTPIEQAKSDKRFMRAASYAKRFAAKEAFSKALGTGFRMKLNFKDIEVVNDKMGKPNYVTNKKITKMIQNKFKIKKYNCFLSISDEKKYSTAFAIIQS